MICRSSAERKTSRNGTVLVIPGFWTSCRIAPLIALEACSVAFQGRVFLNAAAGIRATAGTTSIPAPMRKQ
jgi:acetoin utilization deacetylase AcuC-like enzyme